MTMSVRARILTRTALVGTLVLGGLASSAVPAQATITTPEKQMMYLTNLTRRAHGLPLLSWSSSLSDRARYHTRQMVSAGKLYHSNPLSAVFRGYSWRIAGENVGYGGSISQIFNAFMNSAGHRANILNSRFRVIGAGVVYRNGIPWITVEYYG
jgi:uncharacterized protein YkwD